MSKIYLALSGGVDSAVAGYLLSQEYDKKNIIAVHVIFSDNPALSDKILADKRSAKDIAAKLGIRFKLIDLTSEFKEKVVKDYLNEYSQGRTPNPCVICNREIKFGLLKDRLIGNKRDRLATGHYIRLRKGLIYKGLDRAKDQSYFMWSLKKDQLKNLLYPLGKLKKEEVKKIAKTIGIEAYRRPESAGACFFPKNGHKKFISKNFPGLSKKGEVVNKQGKIIGTHKGIAYYTIGQRYGFEIDPRLAGLSGGDIPPLYVIDLKPELNKIVVGLEKDLFKNEFTIKNTNWFISPDQDSNLKVQIRHLGKLSKAELKKGPDNCYLVKSEENFRSVMPGQSAVFYRDDLLVGGGLISK